jgi:RimJ/RimL family protein N-acetyltransferase
MIYTKDKMSLIEITKSNIYLLEHFLENTIPTTFRYFNNKTAEQIIKNHYITILYIENEKPIGYAHIDYDIINNKYWFGICVLSDYCGKGIGTKLIKKILTTFNSSDIDTLYLTVDKINTIAYNLYLKNGFKLERETDNISIMRLIKSNILYLPVSFGEAVDKLTILDIKMNKINDSRKYDVEIEYNKLKNELKSIITPIMFYYNALKMINLAIWEDQDTFRYSSDEIEKTQICKKIIEDNDARFRIKNKINYILQSHLKEQKGYNPKVFTINYSDNKEYFIDLNTLIKYHSIFNDKVIINCNNNLIDTLQEYYKYDPSIEIICNTNVNITSDYINSLKQQVHNKKFYSFIQGLN